MTDCLLEQDKLIDMDEVLHQKLFMDLNVTI